MSEERELLDKIDWAVPAPEDTTPWVPIISPKAGGAMERAMIVCPHVVAVDTHYLRNRTKPCLGMANGCEGCSFNLPKRWKGYLGCWSVHMSRYVLGELTKAASTDLRPLINDRAKSLRGLELIMWRVGAHKNAPVKARIDPLPFGKKIELPEPFDIRLALLKIWERNTDKGVKYENGPEEEEIPT